MRFVFIRDGFSWGAFLFGPFWMLRHRMWLMLAAYLGTAAALGFAVEWVDPSMTLWGLMGLLLALFVGVEGTTLRRWTLDRRGWVGRGVVVGDDVEAAERRYFDAWIAREESPRAAATSAIRSPLHTSSSPGVIGLFPESGMQR
jgi:hypothetical protein